MTTPTDNASARLSNRISNARGAIEDNLHHLRRRIAEYETAIQHGEPLPTTRFTDMASALDDTIAAERAWQTARQIVEDSDQAGT